MGKRSALDDMSFEPVEEPKRRGRPIKKDTKYTRPVRAIRPDDAEELDHWQQIATREHITLHELLLFSVRHTVQQLEDGTLTLEKQETTTTRLKMP